MTLPYQPSPQTRANWARLTPSQIASRLRAKARILVVQEHWAEAKLEVERMRAELGPMLLDSRDDPKAWMSQRNRMIGQARRIVYKRYPERVRQVYRQLRDEYYLSVAGVQWDNSRQPAEPGPSTTRRLSYRPGLDSRPAAEPAASRPSVGMRRR